MSPERQYSNKIDLLISKLNMNSIGEKEIDFSSELDLAQWQSTFLKDSNSDTEQHDCLHIKKKSRKHLEDLLAVIYEALEYGLSKVETRRNVKMKSILTVTLLWYASST